MAVWLCEDQGVKQPRKGRDGGRINRHVSHTTPPTWHLAYLRPKSGIERNRNTVRPVTHGSSPGGERTYYVTSTNATNELALQSPPNHRGAAERGGSTTLSPAQT